MSARSPAPAGTSAERAAESGHAAALRGWRSRLAALVAAGLVVLTLTGLWLELAPFTRASEIQLLLHTLLGLLLLPPTLWYLVRHLRTWWHQRLNAELLLGYLLGTAVLALAVTGLVVTWQAFFGPRLGRLWHLVHLVVGLAAPVLIAAHLVTAWQRRRLQAARSPELAGAQRGFARRLVAASAGTALAVAALAALLPAPPASLPLPEDYGLPAYAQQFDEYRGNPFAPSYARTADLRLVRPEILAGSASCGSAGCHAEILAEWEPSAHRFAAMNAPFQAVQRAFAADREPAETRYCAGCHDPISLFAGAKDIHSQSLSAPGMVEGVSCVACHAISAVDRRGNADYELTAPRRYLWEETDGWRKRVSDFLLRAAPRQHLADYDRALLRTPELCGACHKQFIPEALNRFGFTEGQNQFDEWRRSHWNADDPEVALTCRDCHMRLVPGSSDPAHGEDGDLRRRRDDGAHRHHGFVATNAFMAEVLALPGWERHVALTEEWMRGETALPELATLWPDGPVAALRLEAPAAAAAGEELVIRAVVSNRKAGHNFITGPLDFVRSWIYLAVHDAGGRLLLEQGAIDPRSQEILDASGRVHGIGNARDEGTLVLQAMPIDERGELLVRHELWKSAGGTGKRVIYPNMSDAQVYRLRVPADARGPLVISAELRYRRYRQQFLDLMVPELGSGSGVVQRTTVQATADAVVELAPGGVASGG
jgi:hypothetical protein